VENMNNDSTQEAKGGKKGAPIKLIIILGCLVLCVGVVFATLILPAVKKDAEGSKTSSPVLDIDPNAQPYAGKDSSEAPDALQTQIPGYDKITLDSASKKLNTTLQNPHSNLCYFVISITADGKQIYRTKMIPPGQRIVDPAVDTILSKGEYDAVVHYECFNIEGLAKMNGADVNTKLIVQ